MTFNPIDYAGKHPYVTGGVILVGGFAVLSLFGAFRGPSSAGASNGGGSVDAYLSAQSADAQAGDAVQIAAIQAQAGTAQTQLNDNAAITINSVGTAADVTENASNNATALSSAPFDVEAVIAQALGAIGAQPPTTVKTVSTNNGFFGIGGGTTSSTSVVPNPASENAAETLSQALSQFSPGH